jgi:hypothetical protein
MCVSDEGTSNVALELTAASSELHVQYGVWWRGVSQLCVGRPRKNICTPGWLLDLVGLRKRLSRLHRRQLLRAQQKRQPIDIKLSHPTWTHTRGLLATFRLLIYSASSLELCTLPIKSRRADTTA